MKSTISPPSTSTAHSKTERGSEVRKPFVSEKVGCQPYAPPHLFASPNIRHSATLPPRQTSGTTLSQPNRQNRAQCNPSLLRDFFFFKATGYPSRPHLKTRIPFIPQLSPDQYKVHVRLPPLDVGVSSRAKIISSRRHLRRFQAPGCRSPHRCREYESRCISYIEEAKISPQATVAHRQGKYPAIREPVTDAGSADNLVILPPFVSREFQVGFWDGGWGGEDEG